MNSLRQVKCVQYNVHIDVHPELLEHGSRFRVATKLGVHETSFSVKTARIVIAGLLLNCGMAFAGQMI